MQKIHKQTVMNQTNKAILIGVVVGLSVFIVVFLVVLIIDARLQINVDVDSGFGAAIKEIINTAMIAAIIGAVISVVAFIVCEKAKVRTAEQRRFTEAEKHEAIIKIAPTTCKKCSAVIERMTPRSRCPHCNNPLERHAIRKID